MDVDLNKYSKQALVMVFGKLMELGFPLDVPLIVDALNQVEARIKIESAYRGKRRAEAVYRAVDQHPRATATHRNAAKRAVERARRRCERLAKK